MFYFKNDSIGIISFTHVNATSYQSSVPATLLEFADLKEQTIRNSMSLVRQKVVYFFLSPLRKKWHLLPSHK